MLAFRVTSPEGEVFEKDTEWLKQNLLSSKRNISDDEVTVSIDAMESLYTNGAYDMIATHEMYLSENCFTTFDWSVDIDYYQESYIEDIMGDYWDYAEDHS